MPLAIALFTRPLGNRAISWREDTHHDHVSRIAGKGCRKCGSRCRPWPQASGRLVTLRTPEKHSGPGKAAFSAASSNPVGLRSLAVDRAQIDMVTRQSPDSNAGP